MNIYHYSSNARLLEGLIFCFFDVKIGGEFGHKPTHPMTSLLTQLDSVMVSRVARQALSDWIAGKISAPIALLALLNVLQQPEALRAALEPLLA